MGEILGAGITHYPPMLHGKPETYSYILKGILKSPRVPEEMKDPKNWPAGMQDEWNNEVERAHEHQARHRDAFRKVRAAIDDFNPDVVIVFGDDQYENFTEDIIPPFNIYCMDEFPTETFYKQPDNFLGVGTDYTVNYKGAGKLAQTLASELIERGFPISYSYKNLHFEHGLSHAFANGLTFLDWDQKGFPYPIIPIQVNCYGRDVVSSRGGTGHVFDTRSDAERTSFSDYRGPSGPTPATCYQLGKMIQEIMSERPERVVIMASSGWSHAFLTEKHSWLYPDREFDGARFEQLKAGEQSKWETLTNDEIDDAGDAEFKNWICLAGAMEGRQPEIVEYLETWIFNSEKCWAVFPTNGKNGN
jgi:aromatic ring-opening dioxygenase catalytic subunit (LigB family)